MATATWREIETQVNKLPRVERLLLIERVIHGLRTSELTDDWDAQLDAMAADPEIQRELAAINREFANTEMDGLEQRRD